MFYFRKDNLVAKLRKTWNPEVTKLYKQLHGSELFSWNEVVHSAPRKLFKLKFQQRGLSEIKSQHTFQGGPVVKNPTAKTGDSGDTGLIPGSGEGNGKSVQYSCLGNPMDRGAWWSTVHGVRVRHDLATKWQKKKKKKLSKEFYRHHPCCMKHRNSDENTFFFQEFLAPFSFIWEVAFYSCLLDITSEPNTWNQFASLRRGYWFSQHVYTWGTSLFNFTCGWF